MAFTYDGTLDTDLEKCRLEIGDVDSTDPLYTDAEINYWLGLRANSILLAAADACDAASRKYARAFDFETDQQKFSRSAISKAFADRAADLRKRASGVTSVTSTRVDGFSQDVTNTDASTAAGSGASGRVRSGYYNDDVPY